MEKNRGCFLSKFFIGLIFALTGAYLMLDGVILGDRTTGIATIMGIIGIALIATSPFGPMKKK